MSAEPIESYELSINTGNSGAFEAYGVARADIILLGRKGRRLATITFHQASAKLPYDKWRDTDEPELHLPTDMLTSVLALLEREKPVHLTYGERTNRTPWGILTTSSED
jgi:hypothetical protein